MRKTLFITLGAIILIGAIIAWLVFGPGTSFTEKRYFLNIKSFSDYSAVLKQIETEKIITSPATFNFLAKKIGYPQKVKAGRYEIKKGMSVFSILRMLKNGRQSPVNLVITKLRTKEDFAGLVGRKFECDSAAFIAFLNNQDSLKKYGLDTNTIMTAVLPNTYTYFWNITPTKVFSKIFDSYSTFWTAERKQKAAQKGLDPQKATILASIVEEETNKNDEKGNIASVYLNRMAKGMRLGADPTVKFALKDFSLKRIYNKHLAVESPYNTYRVYGLPPGPICTPSEVTIDAVLDAPKTDYVFFVAKSDFSGHHNFAATYEEHLKYAKEYQQALDKWMEKKAAKDSLETN